MWCEAILHGPDPLAHDVHEIKLGALGLDVPIKVPQSSDLAKPPLHIDFCLTWTISLPVHVSNAVFTLEQ
jgi:hypothetical protein